VRCCRPPGSNGARRPIARFAGTGCAEGQIGVRTGFLLSLTTCRPLRRRCRRTAPPLFGSPVAEASDTRHGR
jgi:hypothetical protein